MEKDRYLESNEQLILAAKINQIGDHLPEDEATFHLISYSQDIVKLLENRIEPSQNINPFILDLEKRKTRRAVTLFSAATNAGNLNLSLSNLDNSSSIDNPYIYRVGRYSALKHNHDHFSELILMPFRYANHNAQKLAYKKNEIIPITSIAFDSKDKHLLTIAKINQDGELIFVWGHTLHNGRPRNMMREKNLLYKKLKK